MSAQTQTLTLQRLVTQFDDSRMRATVATPTCSSCCCCCCCAGTILATSAVTTMNIARIGRARRIGVGKLILLELGGLLSIVLAVVVTYLVGVSLIGGSSLIVDAGIGAISWIAILGLLYKLAGFKDPSRIIAATVGLGVVAFIIEGIVGLYCILSGDYGIAYYAGAALVIGAGLLMVLLAISKRVLARGLLPASIAAPAVTPNPVVAPVVTPEVMTSLSPQPTPVSEQHDHDTDNHPQS